MFYHIMLKTDSLVAYELDKTSLGEIKEDIVTPFLQNQSFQFDGYFIEPSQVRRLVIAETEKESDVYYELERSRQTRIRVYVPKGYLVTLDERFCNNITKDVMKEVKTHLLNASTGAESSAASALKQTDRQTIFLAYGYRADDEEFISGFRDLLADKGWQLLDGKADRLGSVSQAILEKIGLSDCVIIVMTKRDKKENGQFTTAAWLLEEKGAAIALQKRVIMLVEEGVDPSELGGLQGDDQRFPFTRNNFLQVAMNLTRILDRSSD